MRSLVIFLSLLMSAGSVHAQAPHMELYAWTLNEVVPPLIIGVRENETPQQAAELYLRAVENNAQLRELLEKHPFEHMGFSNIRKLSDNDFLNRVLLLANRPEDYASQLGDDHRGNWRMESFSKPLLERGVHSYMAPFAGGIQYASHWEFELYQNLLNQHFPSMIAMGGDDIDLKTFAYHGEGSKYVNNTRDVYEKVLLERKVDAIEQKNLKWVPPGVKPSQRVDRLLGICRGEQFIGLVLGFQVVPNIEGHGGHTEVPVGNAGPAPQPVVKQTPMHGLRFLQTAQSVLKGLFAGLEDDGEVQILTYHHQCLLRNPNARGQVALEHPDDQCVEGIESLNGNVIGLQGHPELMEQRTTGRYKVFGQRFMHRVADWLTPMRPENCGAALKGP